MDTSTDASPDVVEVDTTESVDDENDDVVVDNTDTTTDDSAASTTVVSDANDNDVDNS